MTDTPDTPEIPPADSFAPTAEQVRSLIATLDTVGTEIGLLRIDLEHEHRVRVRQIVAVIVGVALLAAVFGTGWYDSRRKENQIVSDRTSARVTSCVTSNDAAKKQNDVIDADEQTIQSLNVPNPNRTPAEQMALDSFVESTVARYEKNKVPLRDCSPAAVNAFYNSPASSSGG